MSPSLTLAMLAVVQVTDLLPSTQYDRVVTIELTAQDDVLQGHGLCERTEFLAEFSGTLHIWTKPSPDLDLFLRVEEADGKLVDEDDDSGGGKSPYVRLDVEAGRRLQIVAAMSRGAGSESTGDRSASLELHLVAAPESDATRDAAQRAKRALQEVKQLRAATSVEAARERAATAVDELLQVTGVETSELVATRAGELGYEAYMLSLPEPAQRAWRSSWRHLARTRPSDHPDLQLARLNLAEALRTSGDLAGAQALQEAAFEVNARTLPHDHAQLQTARLNLAATMYSIGDLARARSLFEAVVEVYTRTRPDDDSELQKARTNLAATMKAVGDLTAARALEEHVLEVRSRTLPDEHPALQRVRGNLATTLNALGDLAAARALEEKVLEVRSRTLPDEHRDLQVARGNLAVTLSSLRDHAGALPLLEKVVAVRSRTLPDEHPDLQSSRTNLAHTLRSLGDLQRARELEEKVLEVRARTLPDDHPDLLRIRQNLATTFFHLGDLTGALALSEQVLDLRLRTLPEEHLDVQGSRQSVAGLIAAQCLRAGDAAGRESASTRCVELIRALCRAQVRVAREAILTAPVREAEERCSGMADTIDAALSYARGFGVFEPLVPLEAEAFVLVETTRGAALVSAELTRRAAHSPSYAKLRAELTVASSALATLARKGMTSDEFERGRVKRETIERELVGLSRELGGGRASDIDLDAETIAAKLGARRAAVAFRRYASSRVEVVDELDSTGRPTVRSAAVASLCAFVVRGYDPKSQGGSGAPAKVTFVDLGPSAPVEEAVRAWRNGLGIGSSSRGVQAVQRDESMAAVDSHGATLRERLLDPLLTSLAGVQHIVVILDDVLHLVPLDAVPLDERTRVGDRWQIETRATLAEFLLTRPPMAAVDRLVAFGAVAYAPGVILGDPVAQVESVAVQVAPRDARNAGLLRGSAWSEGFSALPGTGMEVRGIARRFRDRFGPDVATDVYEDTSATRDRLLAQASKARYLHIATHGWFAPDSIKSWSDPEPLDKQTGLAARMTGEEQVARMSPMLLCGLAFAGANSSEDELGRVPGLVTAEELSTLDLSNCELAVLSACDTNVGERRAGQGVASLQRALQMAGARSVITSLWKVPDEATKELMLDFYRRMWVEGKPKHQALWEAKTKLREAKDGRGAPLYTTRDWAAWVLTGDPD